MEEKNNPEERVYTPASGAVIDQEIPTSALSVFCSYCGHQLPA